MARRGENIYKRKDGRWEGRFIEKYDAVGKAKYRSVYGASYTEVKKKLCDRNPSAKLKGTETTVSDWIDMYLEKKKNLIKISTYKVYKRYADNHIKPFFKGIKLKKLNKEILQGFINSLHTFSKSTIKGVFCLIKETLKAAHEEGYIDAIWVDIKLPRQKKKEVKVFTKCEQQKIEAALNVNDTPSEIGILICLYTGIRIGELCGLRWSDIDLQSRVMTINRTAQRLTIDGKSKVIELPPKSETSQRTIPIPAKLAEYISKVQHTGKYVIPTDSHITDPRTYQNRYRKILDRAGVEYSNFHTLRHTFSVRALEIGFDIKTLSEILGHASTTITLQKYAHSLDEHKRTSMEKLNDLWVK